MKSYHRDTRLALVIGCISGMILAKVIRDSILHPSTNHLNHFYSVDLDQNSDSPVIYNNLEALYFDKGDIAAKILSRNDRILCWVMTQPKTLNRAKAVKDTWGKRCNVLIFFSSVEDRSFPVIGLNVPEGRENLWLKTKAAWTYVYKNYINDADWFIKVDDDTFIVVENLRYFLSSYNTTNPHYFGRHFVPFGGYNSGGAGYIFSKETLRRFNRVTKDPSRCKIHSAAEDKEVGVCLAAVGVHPEDTRDALARETFHPFAPDFHLIPGSIPDNNWLHKYSKWPVLSGPKCCSEHSIAFHYITPERMYAMNYFLYHLHAYGIYHGHV